MLFTTWLEQRGEIWADEKQLYLSFFRYNISGIKEFCITHPETSYIYDIKHKTAAILKCELASNGTWQKITQLAAKTKHQVHQTSLAFLEPPNQKTKARYMNVDSLIQWGKGLQER